MKLIITDIENFAIPVQGDHQVIRANESIPRCTGCFGCWVKTPGQCVIQDGYHLTGRDLSKCAQLILVSRCVYGSPSPPVKAVLDRAISYIHPDFAIRQGKMHHKRRYSNQITLSAYFYGEHITPQEQATARKILLANAVNYDGAVGSVSFYSSIEKLEEVTL